MAFEFRPGGDLKSEFRRAGDEQIGEAIRHLSTPAKPDKAIHEARKCLKRARALLRLARPALKGARGRKLELRLADIARSLSGQRDAKAMLEVLDGLEARFGNDWNAALLASLRAGFHGRLQRGDATHESAMEQAVQRLEKARKRFAGLAFSTGQFPLGAGIETTYARARQRFRNAYELGEGTAFHEWRKDAQRHWRQMQLLTAAWPDAMAVRIAKARALSQSLGDDHDIHVLLGHLRTAGPELASWSELESFYDGCIERQLALRMAARNDGRLLFAERPGAFRRRIMRYWQAAGDRFSQGADLRAGPAGDQTVVAFPGTALEQEPADTQPHDLLRPDLKAGE